MVFPNIGMEDLVANAVQVLPDVTITVVTSDRYFNDPTSDERLDGRDAINGETPELISTKEVDYALSQMIADMRQHISKPGLAILDDNRFPKINIIGAIEAIGLDFKMVSPARADIDLNHMPRCKDRQMQLKWLGKLEDTK
ncbi:hypothetical protein DID88_002494 [Monilinia fructigena]|uniref:Uncharacterized protein n=1 Tax=Monilinia fructigena TaxID=38457 RepID=A0A395INW4_9HELO|nr:hypothetical protein DID88_002494 [Monilinia fructigena]